MYRFRSASVAVVLLTTVLSLAAQGNEPGHYGFGKIATEKEIAGWDIDVRPDGRGLPPGNGSVEDGEYFYEDQCAECHGSFGEGVGQYPVLSGGEGTLTDNRPHRSIGSYWPHTSTLWDYIHRAMPYTQPESLSDNEVYAIVAYVLYLNDLVGDDFVLSQANFTSIKLPNESNFVDDQRPDTSNTRCMKNCKNPLSIEILSMVKTTTELVETVQAVKTIEGANVYLQACALCHDRGINGAPVMGEKRSWQKRIAQGLDVMVRNAVEGFEGEVGIMVPKGGFSHLSDSEVDAAVRYMVEASQ